MKSRHLKRIPGLLLTVVLMALAIEFSLRFILWTFAPLPLFNTFASINQLHDRYQDTFYSSISFFVPHRYLGYSPTPNYRNGDNRHNNLGYRGDDILQPKPDGTFRIVAIGASTTYSAIENDYRRSYPYLLQAALHAAGYRHIEVVNAGVHGYTTLESLLNLQLRVLDLDPDMLIIYHGINDIEARLVWPPDAYRSDYSGSRSLSQDALRMPSIVNYSTALRILGVRFAFITSHSSLDFNLLQHPTTYYGNTFLLQQGRGVYPQGIFTNVPALEMLRQNPPVHFESNLRSMIHIAQQNDIQVMLMTFAHSPRYSEVRIAKVDSAEYQMALDEHNAIVRRVATDEAILCLDLEVLIPDEKRYFADGHHFTEAGNRLRAYLIRDYLIQADRLNPPILPSDHDSNLASRPSC